MRVSQGRVLVTGASRGIGRAVVACLVPQVRAGQAKAT